VAEQDSRCIADASVPLLAAQRSVSIEPDDCKIAASKVGTKIGEDDYRPFIDSLRIGEPFGDGKWCDVRELKTLGRSH
jgi:hypothetical protein